MTERLTKARELIRSRMPKREDALLSAKDVKDIILEAMQWQAEMCADAARIAYVDNQVNEVSTVVVDRDSIISAGTNEVQPTGE